MQTKTSRQQSAQTEQRAVQAQPDLATQRKSDALGSADVLLGLQRSHGNRFVQRLLDTAVLQRSCGCGTCAACAKGAQTEEPAGLQQKSSGFATFIQAKLTVSSPGDAYELEADRVAEEVMRMSDRAQASEGSLAWHAISTFGQRAFALQGFEGQEEEEPFKQAVILRKAEYAMPQTAAQSALAIEGLLDRRQTGGEPLPASTRRGMEGALGHDFLRVRIHRDAEAGAISRQLGALAFTHGNHIYFGDGMYDPDGSSGKRLLAHELTHVVQQGQATPKRSSEAAPPIAMAQAAASTIQRVATWAAGTVHEVNNLANSVINGPAVGFTPPMLNGSIIMSPAAAGAAMHKPTLAFSSAASGGVNAIVAAVPTNTGSFDESVLAPGPWTIAAPKATIGARLPALAACAGPGNSTFQAIGDPTDAAMFAANRRHEDHHATDHHTSFDGSIVPWDTRLTTASTAGTTFNGATEATAEAALYAAMGGTPDQVASAYFNAAVAANNLFHGTAAGGPVGAPTGPTANADCSTSSANYHNPS